LKPLREISVDTDIGALVAIAKVYFDAAYDMDADKQVMSMQP
jgi:hypothetical protein